MSSIIMKLFSLKQSYLTSLSILRFSPVQGTSGWPVFDLIWPHLFSLSSESASRFLKVLNCSVGTNDFDDVPLNGQLFKPIFEKCFQGHLKRMLEFKYKGWFSFFELLYTQCTLELRPVKLLFVIFERLSYSFLSDLKINLSVHWV